MRRLGALFLVLVAATAAVAADGGWLRNVPASERARTNPYAGRADAVAAGATLYHADCAHCHGDHAEGKGRHPALRSQRIRQATDGEIAWLLKNGNIFRGMPSWSSLPEPERWQIVAFLRSLDQAKPEGTR